MPRILNNYPLYKYAHSPQSNSLTKTTLELTCLLKKLKSMKVEKLIIFLIVLSMNMIKVNSNCGGNWSGRNWPWWLSSFGLPSGNCYGGARTGMRTLCPETNCL